MCIPFLSFLRFHRFHRFLVATAVFFKPPKSGETLQGHGSKFNRFDKTITCEARFKETPP
jgi:hypothetical protein